MKNILILFLSFLWFGISIKSIFFGLISAICLLILTIITIKKNELSGSLKDLFLKAIPTKLGLIGYFCLFTLSTCSSIVAQINPEVKEQNNTAKIAENKINSTPKIVKKIATPAIKKPIIKQHPKTVALPIKKDPDFISPNVLYNELLELVGTDNNPKSSIILTTKDFKKRYGLPSITSKDGNFEWLYYPKANTTINIDNEYNWVLHVYKGKSPIFH